MGQVSSAILAVIEQLESGTEDLEDVLPFVTSVREMAQNARVGMTGLNSMAASMKDNARATRILRQPTNRVLDCFDRFAQATSIADEWDRRLQALGVPAPEPQEVS